MDEMNDVFQVRQNEPNTYVGLHITRNRKMRSLFLDQTQYVDHLLKRYSYTNLHLMLVPVDPDLNLHTDMDHDTADSQETEFPYKQLLGSVAFAAPGTRPDIA